MLEFCGGGAVDNIIVKLCRALEEDEVRYIGYYVCDALKWLHSQNVIHRDLKAGNILLTNNEEVSEKLKSKREKRDTFIGTPYWMAPEVLACENFEDQPYDSISDIWSLGITLIEISKCLDHSAASFLNNVHRADPPCATITSIFIQPIRKTELLFSEWLSQSLVKDPRSRSSAAQLSDHLWFKDAPTKRTTILELLKKPISTQQVVAPTPSVTAPKANARRLGGRNNGNWKYLLIIIIHFCSVSSNFFMTFRVFLNW
ncbi:hypothetical protein CAEBREN_03844 [Caenorhabditis brenneri]|uniref:Protein kinase domain-containing protein n=1 Tax=Caenorhabditis brenneri TaxID=135651 RepID=G0NYB8_CAEBE|nr:hypothetical protein CAEBREN_03844 [Caenorhabditis brenneri]